MTDSVDGSVATTNGSTKEQEKEKEKEPDTYINIPNPDFKIHFTHIQNPNITFTKLLSKTQQPIITIGKRDLKPFRDQLALAEKDAIAQSGKTGDVFYKAVGTKQFQIEISPTDSQQLIITRIGPNKSTIQPLGNSIPIPFELSTHYPLTTGTKLWFAFIRKIIDLGYWGFDIRVEEIINEQKDSSTNEIEDIFEELNINLDADEIPQAEQEINDRLDLFPPEQRDQQFILINEQQDLEETDTLSTLSTDSDFIGSTSILTNLSSNIHHDDDLKRTSLACLSYVNPLVQSSLETKLLQTSRKKQSLKRVSAYGLFAAMKRAKDVPAWRRVDKKEITKRIRELWKNLGQRQKNTWIKKAREHNRNVPVDGGKKSGGRKRARDGSDEEEDGEEDDNEEGEEEYEKSRSVSTIFEPPTRSRQQQRSNALFDMDDSETGSVREVRASFSPVVKVEEKSLPGLEFFKMTDLDDDDEEEEEEGFFGL